MFPQRSLHDVDPAHQNKASRGPGTAPRLASQQQYPLQPQPSSWVPIASAPFPNHFSVPSPSQYTPFINLQDLALPPQHYAGSQAVPQYSRPSYLPTAPTPDDHSVSHHGYRERDNITPSIGFGDPLSGDELGSHNRSNSGRNPMDDLSCQNVQGPLVGPYNPGFGEVGNIQAQQHRTKQSITNQTDASRGIYRGMSSLDDDFGLNSMRTSRPSVQPLTSMKLMETLATNVSIGPPASGQTHRRPETKQLHPRTLCPAWTHPS